MKKILACSILLSAAAMVFALPNLIETQSFNHMAVNNLDFNLASEELVINETFDSNITIEIYCNNKKMAPEINCSGQNLSVVSRLHNSGFLSAGTRCTLIMYIPQGKNFKNIRLQASSGEIKLERELSANSIKITTSSGDIEGKQGLFADDIYLKASSGEIDVNNLDADTLEIETSSGDIEVQNYTGGSGSLKASSGSIDVDDFAVEYAKFKTSSGKISVKNLDCDYFDFESSSGSQYTTLKNPPLAKSAMKTTSGSIDITVPEGSSFEIDVHSNSGTFKDGFSNNKFVPRSTFHERINDGGATIELSTTSGSIELDF